MRNFLMILAGMAISVMLTLVILTPAVSAVVVGTLITAGLKDIPIHVPLAVAAVVLVGYLFNLLGVLAAAAVRFVPGRDLVRCR